MKSTTLMMLPAAMLVAATGNVPAQTTESDRYQALADLLFEGGYPSVLGSGRGSWMGAGSRLLSPKSSNDTRTQHNPNPMPITHQGIKPKEINAPVNNRSLLVSKLA